MHVAQDQNILVRSKFRLRLLFLSTELKFIKFRSYVMETLHWIFALQIARNKTAFGVGKIV